MVAVQNDHVWLALFHSAVGLGAYTAAVFVLGYLTARARWKVVLETGKTSSTQTANKERLTLECSNLLAEIRQELDTHSDSARRLNEQLDSPDRDLICDQAKVTRTENSHFQEFLDDRCLRLKQHSKCRGSALKKFMKTLAGHRRRAGKLDVVLAKFEDRDQFESAISPLRECIRDLQNHNKRLQAELDQTRKEVAQQSQQLEQAQEEARVDVLTGLPNRRAFEEKISELHSLFDRGNSPYVVALLDIDHFKRFNDEHGHVIGDKVLAFVADILRNAQRWTDHVARYGGEEFIVLLPRMTGHKAKFVIDRQRAKIEKAALSIGRQRRSITLSAGVAEVLPGDTISQVLARADQALYAAKAAGRNQTCLEDGGKIVDVSQTQPLEIEEVEAVTVA
ncbi:MAG: GGDEF domain-containing protein [Rhodopirellula sp.]|nr:GGDEF domain-containing protein [Rhodopirellula sp.]